VLTAGCMTLPKGWNEAEPAGIRVVTNAALVLWKAEPLTDTDKCLKECAEFGGDAYLTARKIDSKGRIADKNVCAKIAVKAMQEFAEQQFPSVLETGAGKLENVVRLRFSVEANDAQQVIGLFRAAPKMQEAIATMKGGI